MITISEPTDKLAKRTDRYFNWLSPFRSFFEDFWDDDFFIKPFEVEFPELPDFRLPLMDLKDEEDKYTLETEIPGLSKDNINIEISKDRLVEIKGEKTEDKTEEKKDNYIHKERRTTSFYRKFYLPTEIDPEKVEAKTEDGLLKITFPKKQPEPVKKVEVQ